MYRSAPTSSTRPWPSTIRYCQPLAANAFSPIPGRWPTAANTRSSGCRRQSTVSRRLSATALTSALSRQTRPPCTPSTRPHWKPARSAKVSPARAPNTASPITAASSVTSTGTRSKRRTGIWNRSMSCISRRSKTESPAYCGSLQAAPNLEQPVIRRVTLAAGSAPWFGGAAQSWRIVATLRSDRRPDRRSSAARALRLHAGQTRQQHPLEQAREEARQDARAPVDVGQDQQPLALERRQVDGFGDVLRRGDLAHRQRRLRGHRAVTDQGVLAQVGGGKAGADQHHADPAVLQLVAQGFEQAMQGMLAGVVGAAVKQRRETGQRTEHDDLPTAGQQAG